MQQLSLSLPAVATYTETDFAVSDCNQTAFDWVKRWPQWMSIGLLYGPPASGKTHLAHIWADHTGATFLAATDISSDAVATLLHGQAGCHVVVEDIQHVTDEAGLFHLLNAVREMQGGLLLTSNCPAAQLPFSLADVRSRLLALPSAALSAPDESLLSAVLMKQFADRQLRVEGEVIQYLLPRIERSFAAARAWVERVDEAALQNQRKVTVPLIRELLQD